MLQDMKQRLALIRNHLYDYRRYATHSFVTSGTTREHRRAILRILTHYIEGGMCMPDVRLGYGQEKIGSIVAKLDRYVADFGVDETVLWACDTIDSYLDYHRSLGEEFLEIESRLATLKERHAIGRDKPAGGSEVVAESDIAEAVDFDFRRFIVSRHSVRQYADRPVDDETIRRIVTNAQECPNVCNRQAIRVYAFNEYETVQTLLTYQAGNAGFRPEVRTLFVVTAEMQHMNLIGERFQGWIDGGIFAMMLALSIHAEGLGACFLNWSVEKEQDQALRRKVGIPDSELVITMMAAGYLKPEFRVPVSARKPVEQVLVLNRKLA